MTARWLWIPLLVLGMAGCSVRRVEEMPSEEVERVEFFEDLPAPVGGFFNYGAPLYSTEGWWPSHYTEGPIVPPIRPPSAYDRQPPRSQSPRPSMQAASSHPQAPERHITQQTARMQRVESRKRINARRDPDFRVTDRDRLRRVERLRRARQEAAQTSSEDEEERKEEASRRREARAKKRL